MNYRIEQVSEIFVEKDKLNNFLKRSDFDG